MEGLPQHESVWMKIQQVKRQFPPFQLEGNLNLGEGVGGIDRPWKVYTRMRKRGNFEEKRGETED